MWQEDGIPIKTLADKSGLAITSLTTMLERMEKGNLICRKQDESDKRKTLLFLTDKAKTLKEDYYSVSDEMGNIFYQGFTDEEILRFEAYLDRIRVNNEHLYKRPDTEYEPCYWLHSRMCVLLCKE